MADIIQVSAIIPTFNRRELLLRAIDSVLAQTRHVDEIVVIDDGSSDGTAAALQARYGERVRYAWQPNAGVSAARNHGMSIARGRYFALLDSDDEWLPDKTQRQFDWLQAHPDYGMVVCDVQLVDSEHRNLEIYRRRDIVREDGWALRWVLVNPALAPASMMMRREVYEDIGGFDESLRTAEDIDYHLRIAHRWRIGVNEEVLVRTMRGHEGLSAGSNTYDDYLRVFERAIADAAGVVDDGERQQALANAYVRNARGMLIQSRWRDALRLCPKAWKHGDRAVRMQVLALLPFALRRMVRKLLPRH
ncbi:MAG: glycosyltransferase family 2 protein [Luteimonas sp.]